MLTETPPMAAVTAPRRRTPLLLIALFITLVAGLSIGFFIQEAAARDVKTQLAAIQKESGDARERIKALEVELADRDARITAGQQSTARISELEAQVAGLSRQLSTLKKSSITPQLLSLVDGLANDRLLLVEMRKDPPENRTDARRYWQGIKDVAVKSSPALGPMADKVINAIPVYYSWQERDYPSEEEKSLTYVLTGASEYDTGSKAFWNAFLKIAIDRIDAVVMTAPQ